MLLEERQESQSLPTKRSNKFRKIGIGLIIMSFTFYGGLLIVPLTNFSTGIKLTITSALVILGEIAFWIGGFILGKEVVKRFKKYLNPLNWFKK